MWSSVALSITPEFNGTGFSAGCQMPTKGFYSQSACLLTDGRTSIEGVKRALASAGYPTLKEVPAAGEWSFSGPSIVLGYLPEVNGFVAVDVVNDPWPDAMGDPKSDSTTFGAWGTGQFGPFAFPGGLSRACQNAWAWRGAKAAADAHRGFIRFRMSYVFGVPKDAPLLPKDYDPRAELNFLSELVLAGFEAPGVLGYFNPNGEVLRDYDGFRKVWNACVEQNLVPMPLWMNVRFYNLNDEFGLMDTVGNHQLDIKDVEALFPKSEYDRNDVANYLRNVSLYLLDLNREIQSEEAFDGPGESNLSWVVQCLGNGLINPPRHILRLCPKSARRQIDKAIAAASK